MLDKLQQLSRSKFIFIQINETFVDISMKCVVYFLFIFNIEYIYI